MEFITKIINQGGAGIAILTAIFTVAGIIKLIETSQKIAKYLRERKDREKKEMKCAFDEKMALDIKISGIAQEIKRVWQAIAEMKETLTELKGYMKNHLEGHILELKNEASKK